MNQQIVEELKNSKEYKKIVNTRDIKGTDTLKNQIEFEIDLAKRFCEKLNYKDECKLVELLIYLDYIIYTPFGRRCIRYLERVLSQYNKPFNMKDYKYLRMYQVLTNNKIQIDENLIQSIKKFNNYYYTQNQNFSKPESIAATIRIISGELDNFVSFGTIKNLDERKEVFNKISSLIYKDINNKGMQNDISMYISNGSSLLKNNEVDYLKQTTEFFMQEKERSN